jgi:primosomal protein N' (replication factor Y)
MVLLPEISLTPQLEARFRARVAAPVAVFHSALADGERRRAWLAAQRGEAAVLLGTRSAVFTPMQSPGLIVLDEEHDTSFKQQEGFRFSARDVAVMRASLLNIPVVLGSATPSLESLYNASQGRYRRLHLPERAGGAVAPRFRLQDIRGQRLVEGISSQLAAEIGETLARGEQALLFVNRRGFAPTLICHACGWVAQCRRCDANLVIHVGEQRLRCHHCGFERVLPKVCTGCGEGELHPLGLGTERVEAALA